MAVERSPIAWAILPIQRYADFNGRAPRAEYWWYALATSLLGFALGFADEFVGGAIVGAYGPLSLALTLGLFIPGLAVLVRRLHDIGRSGWWALLSAGSYAFVIIGFIGSDPAKPFGAIESIGTGPILALVAVWIVSAITLLVFLVTGGEEGSNDYGPDPYGRDQLEEIFA